MTIPLGLNLSDGTMRYGCDLSSGFILGWQRNATLPEPMGTENRFSSSGKMVVSTGSLGWIMEAIEMTPPAHVEAYSATDHKREIYLIPF